MDTFTVISELSRRRILDRLLQSDASVTDLVNDLGYSQPLVSKHLRILRETGFVKYKVEAQRRIYSLDSKPLKEIDDWLNAYRMTWNQHVDKLSNYLDRKKRKEGKDREKH